MKMLLKLKALESLLTFLVNLKIKYLSLNLRDLSFVFYQIFLCLQENDYQTVEDLHQLVNHKYMDSIES